MVDEISMPSSNDSLVVALYTTKISGLDDQHWDQCTPVSITHQWSGEPAPQTRHAEVRLSWNSEGLAVRFVGEQREPLVVSDQPVVESKTLGLWDRDVCEVFLAPDDNNPNHYFEFEAAPTGEWIDLALQIGPGGRETEWDYKSGMKTSTRVSDDQIVICIFIPWSVRIPKPDVGDEWRANLFRCIGSNEATRYLAWRPTYTAEPNYHVPEAFGVLRFE